MNCGVGHRCGSDPSLLWLWHRLAATALIRFLVWEPPYTAGAALEKTKRQKKKKKKEDVSLWYSRSKIRQLSLQWLGALLLQVWSLAWEFPHAPDAAKRSPPKQKNKWEARIPSSIPQSNGSKVKLCMFQVQNYLMECGEKILEFFLLSNF